MVNLEQLRRLCEDFRSVPPLDYGDIADAWREISVNRMDIRFAVLADCFDLSRSFWGEGDSGGVSNRFALAHIRIFEAYLPGIRKHSGPLRAEGGIIRH